MEKSKIVKDLEATVCNGCLHSSECHGNCIFFEGYKESYIFDSLVELEAPADVILSYGKENWDKICKYKNAEEKLRQRLARFFRRGF